MNESHSTPAEARFDLAVCGGRVIDPASGLDAMLDVAFANGRVVEIGNAIPSGLARHVIDATGKLVVPGLIDLHSHIYWGGTGLGVEAMHVCRKSGTTTFVDAGSAGAGNFAGLRRFIIETSPLNIFAFLNISFAGIFGFGRDMWVGECIDLRLLNAAECEATVRANCDVIVGLKVRLGAEAAGSNGLTPLRIARELADRIDVPIMVHLDMPPPSLSDVLPLLRAGDIWTHCFRGPPNSLLDSAGFAEETVLKVRERGILFDVGHGFGSFSFDVAAELVGRGIFPDTISSDVHAFSVDGPAHDVLHTASKLMYSGMPIEQVIAGITTAPASAIGKRHLGRLVPGRIGDAVVLEVQQGSFDFVDSHRNHVVAHRRLRPHQIIVKGVLWDAPNKEHAHG